MKNEHISIRPTLKSKGLKAALIKIAKKEGRSLNNFLELKLIEIVKKEGK